MPVSPGEVSSRSLNGRPEERLRHRSVRLRVAVSVAQVAAGEDEAHELRRGYVARDAQMDKGHVLPAGHLLVCRRARGGGAGNRYSVINRGVRRNVRAEHAAVVMVVVGEWLGETNWESGSGSGFPISVVEE